MSPTLSMSRAQRSQRGFTLIEVLIAALVLSVGLLGLVGLQTVSLKMSRGSFLRSQATNLASEITDAMRANRVNAKAYAQNAESASCDLDLVSTASGLADKDFKEWENRLACLLPEGQGNISVDEEITTVTIIRTVTITICWDESHMETAEDDPECAALGLDGTIHFSFATQL